MTVDHTYQVDVPAGVDAGSTLRLSGRGAAGPRGGKAGDLYVHLRVAPHERYRREGNDLVTDVPISIAQAALGTTIELPTLDGDEDLVVPSGTQPGHEFVLRGRGVPRLQGRGRGDLRAQLVVEVPRKLVRRRGGAAAAARRASAVSRSTRRRRGCSRASSRRSRRAPIVDGALRRAAAHVLVADVTAPVARRRDGRTTCGGCSACATASW